MKPVEAARGLASHGMRALPKSQRNLIVAAVVVLVAVAGAFYWYQSGRTPGTTAEGPWPRAAELLAPGPLPEMELGAADAPVTIIEYASMTCIHCATFHVQHFPRLKEKYIDTGKVRFIFREFPFDPLATGAFMLARCTGDTQRYFAFVDLLFHQHERWTRTDDPVNALFDLSKQAGFTAESFDTCLSNQQLLQGVAQVRERAEANFDVNSTPTFFVNGQIARGVQTIEDLDRLIAPHL